MFYGVVSVEKRHFVVHVAGQNHSVKEISADIAESMSSYGINVADYRCGSGQVWAFYFMNTASTSTMQRQAILQDIVEQMQHNEACQSELVEREG
jgi:hypothetical protein